METAKKAVGRLYLCATPIGNLEDMTYRAVRMLGEADIIAAEDTRHTRELLTHFDIHTELTSYHEHNKAAKGPQLVERMLAGDTIVCVSDAGLPGISDPGADLARLAIEAGIEVSPLPGANAALSALICSGLPTERFTFVGFLPHQTKRRRELLENVAGHLETLIFYEAPHHLRETLRELAQALGGGRRAALGRELTKRFEEFRYGTLDELSRWYEEHEPRGEFVIVVAGCMASESAGVTEPEVSRTPFECYEHHLAAGLGRKEAMRAAARELGIGRRDVYKAVLEHEQQA